MIKKKSETIKTNATYQPLRDENKWIDGELPIGVDITGQVLTEKRQIVLTDLGLKALACLDLKSLMDGAVHKLKEILDVEYTKVLELLPGGKKVILRAGAGWSKDIVIDKSTVNLGKNSQAGYTLLSRHPVIVKDLRTEKRFKGPALLRNHKVVSGMSCIIWGKNNKPYGVLGVHTIKRRDFTNNDINFLQAVANVLAAAIQRKQDEEALIVSEERFRTLAEAIPQIVFVADVKGNTTYYNKRWFDYTGLPQQFKPDDWISIIHIDDLSNVLKLWKEASKNSKIFEAQYRLKGRDGSYRWYLGRSIPIKDKTSKVITWFGTATDIDTQKQIEQRKDDFIGLASHELKTPVTSMKMFTQILQKRYQKTNDIDSAKLLDKMDVQLDKLTRLVHDLLDVSRVQTGKLEYKKEKFPIDDLLGETVEELQELSTKHKLHLIDQTQAYVFADKDRIRQVLINLINNAVRYSPNSDKIVISSTKVKDQVQICIQDFGIGIPKDQQDKIFNRFFQVEAPRSQTYPGLGLGLYISKEIIDRHGGKISVKSDDGIGTSFYFTLPVFKRDKRKS